MWQNDGWVVPSSINRIIAGTNHYKFERICNSKCENARTKTDNSKTLLSFTSSRYHLNYTASSYFLLLIPGKYLFIKNVLFISVFFLYFTGPTYFILSNLMIFVESQLHRLQNNDQLKQNRNKKLNKRVVYQRLFKDIPFL